MLIADKKKKTVHAADLAQCINLVRTRDINKIYQKQRFIN